MTVDEAQPAAPTQPVHKWRRRFKRAAIAFVVLLALLIGGLTYAFNVSGLEVNTPNGVNLIIARKPIDGPPPYSADAALEVLTGLAEGNPKDFGSPGYDFDEKRVVVNIATPRGAELYAAADLPEDLRVFVREDAHSMRELDEISRLAFEEIDEFWGAGTDSVNDRLILETNSISPGLFSRVKELFGTEVVAVHWEPLAGRPQLM